MAVYMTVCEYHSLEQSAFIKSEKVTAYVSQFDGYISYIESQDQYPP